MSQFLNLHRTAADNNEALVYAGRCLVWLIAPESTTTGTVTLRNGSATGGSDVKHVAAVGLTQAGKVLGGVLFPQGLTVQNSAGATDRVGIVWEPCS